MAHAEGHLRLHHSTERASEWLMLVLRCLACGVSLRATGLVHSGAQVNFDANTAISLDRSSELGGSTDYMEEVYPVILPVTSVEI